MPRATEHLKLSIMGRPVVVLTSDPALMAQAALACAPWARADAEDGAPIVLDLARAAAEGAGALEIEVDGPRLRLAGAGTSGWADARSLKASCTVSPDPAQAREAIDTLLLFLAARTGRTPLHAAGIMVGEAALLLAGPSGAGKSTLSLAATARGLQLLSDDTVYIQLQPRLRIWGFPSPVHVFPADAPGFIGQTRLRGGKLKAAVAVPAWSEPPVAERAVVVLLQRGEDIRLEPVEPSMAVRALSRLEPGFDLLERESAEAIAAVAAGGAWRLTLTRDPGAAIDLLVERFGAHSIAPAL